MSRPLGTDADEAIKATAAAGILHQFTLVESRATKGIKRSLGAGKARAGLPSGVKSAGSTRPVDFKMPALDLSGSILSSAAPNFFLTSSASDPSMLSDAIPAEAVQTARSTTESCISASSGSAALDGNRPLLAPVSLATLDAEPPFSDRSDGSQGVT